MRSRVVALLNELLQAERAGVEMGVMLKGALPRGFLRNHMLKIEADHGVGCAILQRGIRSLGGRPTSGQSDLVEQSNELGSLEARLALLARSQAWAIARIDSLLDESLPPELAQDLLELRQEHDENMAWSRDQAAALHTAFLHHDTFDPLPACDYPEALTSDQANDRETVNG